jgi:N-6 DNA Methylase/Eco57I restriction-modification methylase
VALKGVSGSLVSTALLEERATPAKAAADLRRTLLTSTRQLGPASSARHVFDALVAPLLRHFALDWSIASDSAGAVIAVLPSAIVAAGAWNADLADLRRVCGRICREHRRWWIGSNGGALRLVDASRAYTRRSLDFDLLLVPDGDVSVDALQHVLEGPELSALEELIVESERHRVSVGRSLQLGVDHALAALVGAFTARRRRPVRREAAMADALTVVYRILFLLFAEARGLVPDWHPVYRESYTIESLRPQVEGARSGAGLWQALQAIARLAHRGCKAGTLTVVPFNGRLFSPTTAPLAESLTVDDGIVRDVLLAVTTDRSGGRRARISYADLGVEQLGAVYERVLESRKSSGTFYTPRSITEYLVRRALAPLVRRRSPEEILALRVVDPAMGSGAFLVAACRYLASAYEEALVAEGGITRGDISASDRAAFRRTVAARCLYGVDLNPTAVQLARLSLWLCTLAADRPLTFLDHRLRAGNSLAGARLVDVARQPPGSGRRARAAPLPLFEDPALPEHVRIAVGRRNEIASEPDDSAGIVRAKERAIDALQGAGGPLASWRAVADAWCAAWFWADGTPPVGPREWPSLSAALRGEESALPVSVFQTWQDAARSTAADERFFHWELEFPEVFFDGDGTARSDEGFDAVIGNPPWTAARSMTRFARESGCYPLRNDGHANLYQLFAERMLQLASPSGRIGMLMPAGLTADAGCGRLRAALFDRCTIDAIIGFENHDAIFPIHRSMKFVLLTATRGGSTHDVPLRCGVRSAADLDDVPDEGPIGGEVKVPVTLVRRFSGAGLALPELRGDADRAILAKVAATVPALGSEAGWHVSFGRELNATDDREHFGATGWPVLEGKHLEPFVAHTEAASQFIEPGAAKRLLGARVGRARLAYREVAAATNRLTLIAAILPAHTVTTHTIFCLREAIPMDEQWCLCGLLNGFVANYLVRIRGGTHVPASVMQQLPVPRVDRSSAAFARIVQWSKQLAADPGDGRTHARLHGAAARAYGLTVADVRHVLTTFPLVPDALRAAALDAFSAETDTV